MSLLLTGAGPAVDVAAWDPSSLTWLARYDFSALGLADAAAIASVPDLSGNARTLSQATAGARPTFKTGIFNGRGVARADGTDDYLITTVGGADWIAGTSLVVFIVRSIRAAVVDSCSLVVTHNVNDDYAGAYGAVVGREPDASKIDAYRNAALSAVASRPSNGVAFVEEHVWNGTTHQLLINGTAQTAVASAGSWASNTIVVASRWYTSAAQVKAQADYGEIALAASLTSQQRADYRAYLGAKFGITVV